MKTAASVQQPNVLFFFPDHLRSGLYGWRDERYELICGFYPKDGPRHNEGTTAFDDAPVFLHDLRDDSFEQAGLAGKMPGRVRATTSRHPERPRPAQRLRHYPGKTLLDVPIC